MDVEIRVRICRLSTFAQNNPSFSARAGVTDVSHYREQDQSAEEAPGKEQELATMRRI